MAPDTSFGGLVKERRVALGMSQAGLADLVGRSASAVRSWERGSSTPTDESVVRSLAAVLGIDEATLRATVGLPAEVALDDADEIGGAGLAAFAMSNAEAPPAADRSDEKLDGTDEEVPAGTEISWDDVAASVRPVPEPAAPAGDAEVDLKIAGDGEDGDLRTEPTSVVAAPLVPEDDLVSEAEEVVPAAEDDGPDDGQPDREPVSVAPMGRRRTAEPLKPAAPVAAAGSAAASASSRTAMMPARQPSIPPSANSYLDDRDQMMTYWIRAGLTVALTLFLLVVLFWALGKLGDSIGQVWDLFKAGA